MQDVQDDFVIVNCEWSLSIFLILYVFHVCLHIGYRHLFDDYVTLGLIHLFIGMNFSFDQYLLLSTNQQIRDTENE